MQSDYVDVGSFLTRCTNNYPQAIEQNVEKYMTEYIKDLDRNATMAAVGQYPVTHRFQATQKEKELRESRERGLETRDEQVPQPWGGWAHVHTHDELPAVHKLIYP